MDRHALEYTRDHYNKHSNQYASTKDALAARAAGPGAPLKKFHNTIKRQLINRFARGVPALLDLACGRGGDIWKWIDAGVLHVKGIDLSPHEILEAQTRYKEAREKRPDLALDFVFEATPELGLSEWKEDRTYDVVTCMFAAHYFFVSEVALKQFLHNVSINLKEGGYFFGTVPDGRRVNDSLQRHWPTLRSPMLTVEARWKGAPEPFGSPYLCAIGDTVTGAERGTEGSLEYLVYSSIFVQVAAGYGLVPVLRYDTPDLDRLLDPADAGKPLKHFMPRFPDSHPSLEVASRLFATFVFQKRQPYPTPVPESLKRPAPSQDEGFAAGDEPQVHAPPSKRLDPKAHATTNATTTPPASAHPSDGNASLRQGTAPGTGDDPEDPFPSVENALRKTRR